MMNDSTINGLIVTSKDLFVLPFGLLVASFLFIFAGAHALIAIPNGLFKVYAADLDKGINKFVLV